MKIGIDARPLSNILTGIGNHLLNILRHMERIDQTNEFYLYSDADFPLPFQNPRWHKRVHRGLWIFQGTLWMMTAGSMFIVKDKINVLWAPWPIIPVFLPIKLAVTVHDFTWKYCPETMDIYQSILLRVGGDLSIGRADAIFAVSDSTLGDVMKLKHKNKRLYKIYNAVNQLFVPYEQPSSAQYIAHKYACAEDYILTVGTIEPRKNIVNLLHAYKKLKERYDISQQLLIAGARGWKESIVFKTYIDLKLTEDVKFLGYVDQEDLPKLYSGAKVFVYPSFYEGFGIPPLEAMACGCPVVISQIASLSEVVGDSGLFVNPHDFKDIADKMYCLLSNKNLRLSLRQKGLERAKLFSWEKSAKIILDVLTHL